MHRRGTEAWIAPVVFNELRWVQLDGEEASVIGKAGLLETDVLTPDGMKTVSNRRLADAAAAARVRA